MFDTIATAISGMFTSMCYFKTSKSIDRFLIHVTCFYPCAFRLVTQGYDRVCRKIYTYLMILSLFRSYRIRKSAYVNASLFSTTTDNQSPRKPK